VTELGELRKHWDEILARGAVVAAISVDPPAISEKLRQRLDLDIAFVSDESETLHDVLNVRDVGGRPPAAIAGEVAAVRDSRDLFMATTYLLDEDGAIRWIYRPESYRVRAPAKELLRALDALGA
jgi:peroxiredoxin